MNREEEMEGMEWEKKRSKWREKSREGESKRGKRSVMRGEENKKQHLGNLGCWGKLYMVSSSLLVVIASAVSRKSGSSSSCRKSCESTKKLSYSCTESVRANRCFLQGSSATCLDSKQVSARELCRKLELVLADKVAARSSAGFPSFFAS